MYGGGERAGPGSWGGKEKGKKGCQTILFKYM